MTESNHLCDLHENHPRVASGQRLNHPETYPFRVYTTLNSLPMKLDDTWT